MNRPREQLGSTFATFSITKVKNYPSLVPLKLIYQLSRERYTAQPPDDITTFQTNR